ncbi:hypothetical protein Adt_20427 [Abeliophyllum distichum]|uniref:Uncharacterized protein n=1 Tax=Abeliophyllum distichum TaxID=126358 RepID=A0ABD1SWK4_9LAMI
MRPRLTMSRLAIKKSKVLVPSSSKDSRQKKVREELSREGKRGEAGALDVVEIEDTNASEVDVPLTRKRKAGTSGVGSSFQPKGKVVEIVDNYAVCGVLPLQRTLSVNPSGEVVKKPLSVTNDVCSSSGGYIEI